MEKVTVIWGVRILDDGFTQIPNLLIRNYRKLGIEHGEFGLICNILTYQFDTQDPYPSIDTLADHMCVSTRQVDKWIKKLKEKKLVRVGHRVNTSSRKFAENIYNFKPLIDTLMNFLGEEALPESNYSQYEVVYEDDDFDPSVPEIRMDEKPCELQVDPSVLEVTKPSVPERLEPNVPQVRSNNSSFKNTYDNTNKNNRGNGNNANLNSKERDPRYENFYKLFPDS